MQSYLGARTAFPQNSKRGLTLTNPLAQEALLPPPNVACVPISSSNGTSGSSGSSGASSSSSASSSGSSSSSSSSSTGDGSGDGSFDACTTVLHEIRIALWSLSQCEQWLTAVAGTDGGYRSAGDLTPLVISRYYSLSLVITRYLSLLLVISLITEYYFTLVILGYWLL